MNSQQLSIEKNSCKILRIEQSGTYTIDLLESAQLTLLLDDHISNDRYEVILKVRVGIQASFSCIATLVHAQEANISIALSLEQNADAQVRGIYLLTTTQKITITTKQEHVGPQSQSSVLVRGILYDAAQAIYQGMIKIHPSGIHTRAEQEHKTLIFGEQAQSSATPSLEVLTHAVECCHGNAVSYVSPQDLFYLQCKGIAESVAQTLLIEGFLGSVIPQDNALKSILKSMIQSRVK